eukprot:86272-Prymnesium_polylepis.1
MELRTGGSGGTTALTLRCLDPALALGQLMASARCLLLGSSGEGPHRSSGAHALTRQQHRV